MKSLQQLFTTPAQLKVKLVEDSARVPTRNNPSDAGLDLYASESVHLPPLGTASISTGISIEIPHGYVALIWPRSGLALKSAIDVFAGVVDSGYRGVIKVILHNASPFNTFNINAGDKIAQMLIQRIEHLPVVLCDDLDESDRGDKGFGSSGQ